MSNITITHGYTVIGDSPEQCCNHFHADIRQAYLCECLRWMRATEEECRRFETDAPITREAMLVDLGDGSEPRLVVKPGKSDAFTEQYQELHDTYEGATVCDVTDLPVLNAYAVTCALLQGDLRHNPPKEARKETWVASPTAAPAQQTEPRPVAKRRNSSTMKQAAA